MRRKFNTRMLGASQRTHKRNSLISPPATSHYGSGVRWLMLKLHEKSARIERERVWLEFRSRTRAWRGQVESIDAGQTCLMNLTRLAEESERRPPSEVDGAMMKEIFMVWTCNGFDYDLSTSRSLSLFVVDGQSKTASSSLSDHLKRQLPR